MGKDSGLRQGYKGDVLNSRSPDNSNEEEGKSVDKERVRCSNDVKGKGNDGNEKYKMVMMRARARKEQVRDIQWLRGGKLGQ